MNHFPTVWQLSQAPANEHGLAVIHDEDDDIDKNPVSRQHRSLSERYHGPQ